jgi:dienelactone hydrolase
MTRYAATLCAAVALAASTAGTAARFQLERLPRPTGPFAVGTTVRHWTDSTRLEGLTAEPHDHRQLDVYIWYPAARQSARSPTPYVPELDGMERVMGVEYLERVRRVGTNSTIEPALSRQAARFPIVVLSHDLGSLPMHYTILAEELASQGYLVAGINHSFGSAATVVPRRGVQPPHRSWQAGFAVTPEAEHFWEQRVISWASDIVFVVNQLAAEHAVRTEFFGGRLDTDWVTAMGHGFGGSAALFAGQADPRIRAVISLDGVVQPLHLRFSVDVPVLWFLPDPSLIDSVEAADRLNATPQRFRAFRTLRDAQRDSLLAQAPAGSFAATIAGVRRYQFSDLPLVLGDPPAAGVSLPASRVVEILRAYVVRFLAVRAGRAGPDELERLGRRYPEVRPVEPSQEGRL